MNNLALRMVFFVVSLLCKMSRHAAHYYYFDDLRNVHSYHFSILPNESKKGFQTKSNFDFFSKAAALLMK